MIFGYDSMITVLMIMMTVLIQLPSKLCYDGICGVTQTNGTAFSVLTRFDSYFRQFIYIYPGFTSVQPIGFRVHSNISSNIFLAVTYICQKQFL